jgi:hypothetical protein
MWEKNVGQSLDTADVRGADASRKPRGAHPAQRLTAVKVKALRIPGAGSDPRTILEDRRQDPDG